jgi:hypothetical protein
MATITRVGSVELVGDIRKPKNVSAVELSGDWLLLGSDETNRVQVLKRAGARYELSHDVTLAPGANEIDIEGLARDGDTVYVLGSHSWTRKKLDPEDTYEQNRAALEKVEREPDRERVCRFHFAADGTASAVKETTLRALLDAHAVLGRFRETPSKENGIDLEGVAVRDGWLYVGFRSPVLRGGWVPIARCRFAHPVTELEVLYVNLGGRGVRDLARVAGGFLVLAGPSGEGPETTQVYLWDGADCVPGTRTSGAGGRIHLLGDLPADPTGKAEGLAVLTETPSDYDLIIVFDGVKNGEPTRFRVPKH